MCALEAANSEGFLRYFFIILMFSLLLNINLTAKSVVLLRGMLAHKTTYLIRH